MVAGIQTRRSGLLGSHHRVQVLPSEDVALILLFSLVVSGQIKLRRIDGWRKIAAVLSQHNPVAA
jgi:hypothetical protein